MTLNPAVGNVTEGLLMKCSDFTDIESHSKLNWKVGSPAFPSCFAVYHLFPPQLSPSHHSTSTVFLSWMFQKFCRGPRPWREREGEAGNRRECTAEMLAPWIIRQGETVRQKERETEASWFTCSQKAAAANSISWQTSKETFFQTDEIRVLSLP